jgi:hypothetical protein
LSTKSCKNHPQKLHTYGSWEFFFSAALTAQNSPEIHFHFINYFIQPSLLESLVRAITPRRLTLGCVLINIFSSRCAKKDPKECFDNREKNGINKFGTEDFLNSLKSSAQNANCLDEGEICCKEEHVIKHRVKRDKEKCSEISGYRYLLT